MFSAGKCTLPQLLTDLDQALVNSKLALIFVLANQWLFGLVETGSGLSLNRFRLISLCPGFIEMLDLTVSISV